MHHSKAAIHTLSR